MKEYRRDIDGLRAVAVLPVMLFHAGFEFFAGGFLGVDIFFVISGYLISTIIFSELHESKFSLVRFYERRARRILPALFFVMAVCIPLALALFVLPTDLRNFSKSVAAVAVFSSNILFWRESGYFDTASELKPLLHTWSLGVEEQYYVFFPILMMVLWRFGKKIILISFISLSIVSLALAQYFSIEKPLAAFFLLPTRGWELLLGGLCAYCSFYRVFKRGNEWLSLLGLSAILFSIFAFDKHTPFPSVYGLIPCLGVVLVILFSTSETWTYRILGHRLLVGIGLISYSAYLWHQPIFAFSRRALPFEPPPLFMAAGVGLSMALAYLTWRFVERPFRDRDRISRKAIFRFSLVGSVLFFGFGVVGVTTNGFRSENSIPSNIQWESLGEKLRLKGDICVQKPLKGFAGLKGCYFGDTQSQKLVALYGDSHGQAISEELDHFFKDKNLKGVKVNLSSCLPIPLVVDRDNVPKGQYDQCRNEFNQLRQFLSRGSIPVVVVIRWTFRLYPIPGEIEEFSFDNRVGGFEMEDYREYGVIDQLGQLHYDAGSKQMAISDFLNGLSEGSMVYLFYPIPEIGWDIAKENFIYFRKNQSLLKELSLPSDLYFKRNRFVLRVFDEIVQTNPRVRALRSDQVFCHSIIPGRCLAQRDSVPLYFDDDHVSNAGAKLLVRELEKAMNR